MMNRLALLVIRKYVRGKRTKVKNNLKALAKAQVERKLKVRAARVLDQLKKYREEYARSMVEWGVEVDSLVEYRKFISDDKKPQKDKVEKTTTIYNCIRYGWDNPQCHTKKSCGTCEKCTLIGCLGEMKTGFGSKGNPGHMTKHVEVMLRMSEAELLCQPVAPPMPEMKDRPKAGNVSLGGRSKIADKMTEKRHGKWKKYMGQAKLDPEKYSRWVFLPAQDRKLVDRKIEMRMQMTEPVEDENTEVTQQAAKAQVQERSYLHCWEGTVIEVTEKAAKVRTVHGVTTKHAVVAIKWDTEFVEWGEVTYHALNPDLYAKENKHQGWNILNEEYILAVECEEANFAKLRGRFKSKAQPDSELMGVGSADDDDEDSSGRHSTSSTSSNGP